MSGCAPNTLVLCTALDRCHAVSIDRMGGVVGVAV